MYRFLETMKLNDGVFFRLKYHQLRVNYCYQHYFPERKAPDLKKILYLQSLPKDGLYKCRVLYDELGLYLIEFIPYQLPVINSLKQVNTTLEAMRYKSAERSVFEQLFAQRGACDDVLLVRNGLLTDTSYANIALFDGAKWVTPRLPVLYGTNRAYLLDKEMIVEKDIKASDLHENQKILLFNAMIEFGELEISI